MADKYEGKYWIGDIINKIVNQKKNPLSLREKSATQCKGNLLQFQKNNCSKYSQALKLKSHQFEPSYNSLQAKNIFPFDPSKLKINTIQPNSRLLERKRIYSNTISISERSRGLHQSPEKALKKEELLKAYIARKRKSGQLNHYLSKADNEERTMFRKTFQALRCKEKNGGGMRQKSAFYLTTMRKEGVILQIDSSHPAKFQNLNEKQRQKLGLFFYRTFYN